MDANNKIIDLIKENARLTSELVAANAEKDRLISQALHEHCIAANIEMFKLHIAYRNQRDEHLERQKERQNEMLNHVMACK